jgi:hypothetical protein
LRSCIYTRGCKLSWREEKNCKAIFFTHKNWGSIWGGEIVLAETPPIKDIPSSAFGHQWEDRFMSALGVGHYVVPKPNRLVLIKSGIWHGINRVDADAGDNLHCSIALNFLG